jgi:O-antigen ligase
MEYQIRNNGFVKCFLLIFCLFSLAVIVGLWSFFPALFKILAIPYLLVVFELTYNDLKKGSLILMLVLPTIYLYQYTGWSNATVADLTIFAVVLAWALCLLKQKFIQLEHTNLDIPLLLFLVFSLIAMAPFVLNIGSISFSNLNDLTNSLYAVRVLLTTIESILVFCFVVNTVRTKEHLSKIILCSIISLAAVSFLAVREYVSSAAMFSMVRIGSTFGPDANAFAMCLIMFIPVLIFSLFYSNRIYQKIIYAVVLVISAIALIVTYSKGAILGLVIACAVMFVLGGKILFYYFQRHWLLFIGFFAFTGIFFSPVLLPAAETGKQAVEKGFLNALFSDYGFAGASVLRERVENWESSFSGRQHLWDSAVKVWLKYPLFGAGLGRFPVEYMLLNEISHMPLVYQLDFVDGLKGQALKLSVNDSSVSLKQFFQPANGSNNISFNYIFSGNATLEVIFSRVDGPLFRRTSLKQSNEWAVFQTSIDSNEKSALELEIVLEGTGAVVIDEVELPNGKNLGFEHGISSWHLNKINPNKLGMIQTATIVTHNIYLNILSERGIFAFIAFVWMIIVIFRLQFRLVFEKNIYIKFISIALTASIVALLVHGFVDNTVFFNNRISMLFWFLVGLLFAKKYVTTS